MTSQATHCLEIYRGGNPVTIKKLLQQQKVSVLKELQDHFGTTNIDKLATCLSLGRQL